MGLVKNIIAVWQFGRELAQPAPRLSAPVAAAPSTEYGSRQQQFKARHQSPPRVHRPQLKVEARRCTGCGACAVVCPTEAIGIGLVAEVDPQRCSACGACVGYCPVDALSVTED